MSHAPPLSDAPYVDSLNRHASTLSCISYDIPYRILYLTLCPMHHPWLHPSSSRLLILRDGQVFHDTLVISSILRQSMQYKKFKSK